VPLGRAGVPVISSMGWSMVKHKGSSRRKAPPGRTTTPITVQGFGLPFLSWENRLPKALMIRKETTNCDCELKLHEEWKWF
jgi:hypothetical protein